MPNETDPNIHRIDVRTVLVGIGLIVTVAGITAGLSRFAWQSDIDRVVSNHTIERSQWRSGIDARISRIEEQCREHKEWRERTDRDLDGLHQWRSNCSVKQSELGARFEQHDRQDDAVINQLNRRQDWLEKQLRSNP